jgi:hypothetical protein
MLVNFFGLKLATEHCGHAFVFIRKERIEDGFRNRNDPHTVSDADHAPQTVPCLQFGTSINFLSVKVPYPSAEKKTSTILNHRIAVYAYVVP